MSVELTAEISDNSGIPSLIQICVSTCKNNFPDRVNEEFIFQRYDGSQFCRLVYVPPI